MITGPKKKHTYSTIFKIASSRLEDDKKIARELLLENFFQFSPKQFNVLHELITDVDDTDIWMELVIEVEDVQKYWHDKWKEKRKTNKRNDIIED